MRVRSHTFYRTYLTLFFGVSFFVPALAYAADLSLTPSAGTVAVGDTISIDVTIKPGGDSVNAADGTISFDSSKLSVGSISKDGSVFSLWTADPSYSNSAGTISFSGGTPTAFSNSGKVLTIVFKGKANGSANISFTKGSILAADGKGTDVYKNGNPATVSVSDAAPADTSSTDQSSGSSGSDSNQPDGATPPPPTILSSTEPKQDSWYSTTTAIFLWQLQSDTTGIRTLFSDNATDTPKVALKAATTTATFTGLKDGQHYFYVQFKNDFGWGETAKYKIQLDTVPPNAFSIALLQPGSDGGPPKLSFKTDDALSGLDHYEIDIGTSTTLTVRTQDVADGTFPVPPQGGGQQTVTIKAFDKAGNMQSATQDLVLPVVVKPKPAGTADDTTAQAGSGSNMGWYVCILLAVILGTVMGRDMYKKKKVVQDKGLLLQAVLDTRDRNDRIFSAMREEFEQMIHNFDPKPQLTPEERDLLENIKEVLDISEELVDTSVEDLKKMVRNLL